MRQSGDISTDEGTIGNPELWQVRDFVEEEGAAPVNPIATIIRLYRGQWLKTLALAVVCGFGLAFTAYNFTKPVYESQGLVRVVAKEAKILYADKDDSRLRLYDAFVSAESTYIQSPQVLSRAHEILIETADSTEKSQPRPTLQSVVDALTVKKLKGLIAVSAMSTDPSNAQQIVNALLRSYTELHTQQSDSRQILRVRELEVRTEELLEKQYALNSQLLQVGEEYDASSLAKAHLTKVTQLEELDIRVGELTNALVEMEAKDGALDADTGDMEIKRATLLDRAMADMVFERAKRAAELEQREMRYMPSHPKIATLTASLRVIDEAIEARRRLIATLGKTGAITGADGAAKSQSLAELHALKLKLVNRRNDLSMTAKVLNGKLIQLKRINAEQAQISGMLAETRRILDQVRLESRNSLPGTIEVLSRGSMPDAPAADKRMQFALLGFMFGGFIAAVAMLLRRQLNVGVVYSDDATGLLPSSTMVTVLNSHPSKSDIAAFFSDIQMSDFWRRNDTNVVSLVQFADKDETPLHLLAETASAQGLKTLYVSAAEDGIQAETGFAQSISGTQNIDATRVGDYDFIPFGAHNNDFGYSLESARVWLQQRAENYDLILVHAGVAERHYSARVLPRLSDLTITSISPGDEKRLIKRFTSQCRNMVPLFSGANDDDPMVVRISNPTKNVERETHEKVA